MFTTDRNRFLAVITISTPEIVTTVLPDEEQPVLYRGVWRNHSRQTNGK